MAKRVLIVEEESDIASLLEMHIADLGYECQTIASRELISDFALLRNYDLIILDLMCPGHDWLDVCREVRLDANAPPILLIASHAEQQDLLRCLEAGVDDYLTKPFKMRELRARVKSIMQRKEISAGKSISNGTYRVGRLSMDVASREAAIAGRSIDLTEREFDLLAMLMRIPGKTVHLTDLYDQVWGQMGENDFHAVQTCIQRLRVKIEEDPSYPQYLQTVPGVGYRIADDLD